MKLTRNGNASERSVQFENLLYVLIHKGGNSRCYRTERQTSLIEEFSIVALAQQSLLDGQLLSSNGDTARGLSSKSRPSHHPIYSLCVTAVTWHNCLPLLGFVRCR